jgi:hypothetical protein
MILPFAPVLDGFYGSFVLIEVPSNLLGIVTQSYKRNKMFRQEEEMQTPEDVDHLGEVQSEFRGK